MIEYKSGDMFKGAPKGSILVHACNARGRWGSGIAVQFRNRFPHSYQEYKLFCQGRKSVGRALLTKENVGCLITSKNYGPWKDSPKKIAEATYEAVKEFLTLVEDGSTIHSPKINNGLFAVPWSDTKKAITKAIVESGKNVKWIVWEL